MVARRNRFFIACGRLAIRQPRGSATMRAHLLIAGALWAVLSVFGEVILFTFSFYPKRASAEAAIVDDAFQLLMVLSAPVFAFVISVLVYSLLRFRSRGEPAE